MPGQIRASSASATSAASFPALVWEPTRPAASHGNAASVGIGAFVASSSCRRCSNVYLLCQVNIVSHVGADLAKGLAGWVDECSAGTGAGADCTATVMPLYCHSNGC